MMTVKICSQTVYLVSFTFKVDNNAACANDIDQIFSGIIEEVASPFKHNIHVSNSENCDDLHSCNNSPWFNVEYFEKRKLFYSYLNLYRNSKTEVNRKNMVTARSQFKTCKRKCKLEFDKQNQHRQGLKMQNCTGVC